MGQDRGRSPDCDVIWLAATDSEGNNGGMHLQRIARERFSAALVFGLLALAATVLFHGGASGQGFSRAQWPKTDFSRTSIDLGEIRSGGPGKDGISAIDAPRFISVEEALKGKRYAPEEAVLGLEIDGDFRAYPLQILMWHEIVNDTVGGAPVSVTYCPLCNSAVVFDQRVAGRILDFGTTGNLRKSDMVMYDRQTESWWQQFLGEGIVGELTGTKLTMLPARVESFERFAARAPDGKVLIPTGDVGRPYGVNPYVGYDTAPRLFLYDGEFPKGIAPLAYVLAVGNEAWSLDLLRREKRIEKDDLVITWEAGQASALDREEIFRGRDIGNVVVQRKTPTGLVDAVHDLTFAFVFHAFIKDGKIHK